MRATQFFLATLKEAPSDAEIVSHKLMLRAGLIKRLAGGIYTWMPLGLRIALNHGARIAQLVIAPVARATIVEVDQLETTARGSGGFGSTGVR